MKPLDDLEVALWLEKARRDIRMAEMAVASDDPLWDQACFHAQQAAEKALKGILVADGRSVPRTHDLVLLADAAKDLIPDLGDRMDGLAELNQFGVAPRYPSWLADETEAEATESLDVAKAIFRSVLECLAK